MTGEMQICTNQIDVICLTYVIYTADIHENGKIRIGNNNFIYGCKCTYFSAKLYKYLAEVTRSEIQHI